jgi:DNA polymerase III epsilon subunit-like protein
MRVFIDFEASSLHDDGYPIEVGWVFEDGRPEQHLIKPAPGWVDWDPQAQALHGISRAMLATGAAHDVVARRMMDILAGHSLYATAPSWDGKWLSALLRAAGLPRHALRLKDSDEAHCEAVAEAFGCALAQDRLSALASELMEQARITFDKRHVRHRAVEDAERERRIWLEVGRLARERRTAGKPE